MDAAEMRAELHAMRSSMFWRMSGPLRGLIEKLRGVKPPEAPAPAIAPGAMSYEDWQESEEPKYLAALTRPLPGQPAVAAQRLGLVILTAAPFDPACLPHGPVPAGWQLMVLCCAEPAPGDARDNDDIILHYIPADFTGADAVGLALQLDVEFIGFHDARDRLAPAALPLAAALLSRQPHLDLIFADEDWLDDKGARAKPFFKPGWDPELQRGRDLIGPFALFRKSLVSAVNRPSGAAWRYDLANQVAASSSPDRIQHIPAVLCHRSLTAAPPENACRAAAAAQLRREGVEADVAPVQNDLWRVSYRLPPTAPLVSVIICTRDHAELLRTCTEGLLAQTDYPRLELIIVDNGTVEPAALKVLAGLAALDSVRVIGSPGPFNWSALNNHAAAMAQGDIILLMNNDIEILGPDWLSVMVGHALQPGVGAVGAKLLYPDGRVQHAGLSTDDQGVPSHLFRFADRDDAGIGAMLGVARGVWGLTGACVAMRRDIFLGVGGLNEAFTVGCNDVDLGLRLTAHGYRLILTPWAVAMHHEQATRPSDRTPEHRDRARGEIDRLIRDWGNLAISDPYLNSNLQLLEEHPVLRPFPATSRH